MAERILRRSKDYRWTSPKFAINSGQELPDGKILVDSDADYEWMAFKWYCTDAQTTFLYRLFDHKMRPISSDQVPGLNDFSALGTTGGQGGAAPEFGWGVFCKVINPYRLIPAGGKITIQLVEFTGQDPQILLAKLTIIGRKVYRF